ncbi:MAG: hypothetical protein HY908_31910 [Myxococcales bacterium]|nr:hypothetical protein [Myxococcales bacterium]
MNRIAPLALLFVLPLGACTPTVTVGGGGGGDPSCGAEPATNPDCPEAWVCQDGTWVDTSGACPEPACPLVEPSSGAACPQLGMTCDYDVDVPCGPYGMMTAVCTTSGWQTAYPACMPEPTCPATAPTVGSDCTGFEDGYYCEFYVDCGELAFEAMACDLSTSPPTWQLQGTPACGDCATAGTKEACGATPGCGWLVPGCADPAQTPIVEGCYPATGCDLAGCATADELCQPFVYDPCADLPCNACGGEYWACVAP